MKKLLLLSITLFISINQLNTAAAKDGKAAAAALAASANVKNAVDKEAKDVKSAAALAASSSSNSSSPAVTLTFTREECEMPARISYSCNGSNGKRIIASYFSQTSSYSCLMIESFPEQGTFGIYKGYTLKNSKEIYSALQVCWLDQQTPLKDAESAATTTTASSSSSGT